MKHKLNNDKTVAVATEVYWQHLDTAPIGVKLQLLTLGGTAVYGPYKKSDARYYQAWAPVPKKPDWITE